MNDVSDTIIQQIAMFITLFNDNNKIDNNKSNDLVEKRD